MNSGRSVPPANGTDRASGDGTLSAEDKDRLVEIWKKTVETQMHFNEMSVKSRQLGLTFVAAALGVGVVMVGRGEDFALSIGDWNIHVGVLLLLSAALALAGVRGLDLKVYHRMLRGAVTFGEDFEQNYMKKIFDLDMGMTQAISHYSRYDDASVNSNNGRYNYSGNNRLSAEKKIRRFYRNVMLFLVSASVALFLINNFSVFVKIAGPYTLKQSLGIESKSSSENGISENNDNKS